MIGGAELVRMLAKPVGGLVVTPILDDMQIGDASIDVRLGPDIIVSRRATGVTAFDPSDAQAFEDGLRRRQQYVRRGIGDPFHLQPGEFVLARTLEYISLPDDVSAEALGRSSWGRLGLTIATATLVQPGFKGTITLELANVGNTPIVLEVGLSIAQLVFARDTRVVDDQVAADCADPEQRAAANRRAEAWHAKHLSRRRVSRYANQVKPALSRLHRDPDLVWVAPISIRYAVGVVGERFAGKSTIVNFLISRRQFRLYRLSQFVYEEARRRGVDVSDKDNLRRVGDELRNQFGDDVIARMAFARIRADHLDPERRRAPVAIVIEGFKVPQELEAWQKLGLFRAVLADATPKERLRRALDSGQLDRELECEPLPDGEQERVEWFRRRVDTAAGLPHPAAPVVQQARSHERTLQVPNDQRGIPRVVDALRRNVVPELERWWRARAF